MPKFWPNFVLGKSKNFFKFVNSSHKKQSWSTEKQKTPATMKLLIILLACFVTNILAAPINEDSLSTEVENQLTDQLTKTDTGLKTIKSETTEFVKFSTHELFIGSRNSPWQNVSFSLKIVCQNFWWLYNLCMVEPQPLRIKLKKLQGKSKLKLFL